MKSGPENALKKNCSDKNAHSSEEEIAAEEEIEEIADFQFPLTLIFFFFLLKKDALQGVFSFTLNERFNINGGFIGILEWIIGERDGYWTSFLARDAMEQAARYGR